MRRTTLLLALAIGAAGILGSSAPAMAVCNQLYYELTGRCSECSTVLKAYDTADRVAKDKLPDHLFACLA